MDPYNKEKSLLRNKQVQELKTLDKDIKKKKGVLRESLEAKLEEAKVRHSRELEELNIKYGHTTSTATPQETNSIVFFYPPRNWNSLGKKDLEIEAQRRGLGKGGSREDLVTKLMIFDSDQNRKVENKEIDPSNVAAEPSKNKTSKKADVLPSSDSENDSDDSSPNTNSVKASPPNTSKFLKETDLSGVARPKHPKASTKSDSSDSDSEDSSSSGSESAHDDVPDSEKVLGSGKQDTRETRRPRPSRGRGRGRGGHGRGRGGHAGGNARASEEPEEPTEEERQEKRERVMQQVLVKLLQKRPRGIAISDMNSELKQLKVANFRPQLLGYDTIEDWIRNQPPQVLHYAPEEGRILPARINALPSEEGEEDI